MNGNTKLAILIATYNGEKYLEEQIQSILDQSYSDWSIFIHDDGSTDNTNTIIDLYVDKYPTRIFRVKGKSCGCARNNFFFLTENVEAEYYMYCDQDDIWLPDKIQKTYNRMKKIEDKSIPTLVYTELSVVDNNMEMIAERMSSYQNLDCNNNKLNRLLIQNVVTGCTMMINRSLRDIMIRYKDVQNIRMHDWWAALIASAVGKISYIDEPTILYRQHLGNSVGAQNDNNIMYQVDRIKKSELMRKSIQSTYIQARELGGVLEVDESHLILQYANCKNMGKLKRLLFYFRNDIFKTGIARLVGQIVLG